MLGPSDVAELQCSVANGPVGWGEDTRVFSLVHDRTPPCAY